MARNHRNWKATNFDPTIVVRTRSYGLDVDWTGGLEADYSKRNGSQIYAMKTLQVEGEQVVGESTTHGVVEVAKDTDGTWAVYLFGEVVSTGYPHKGAAQSDAEALVF